jgi:hypothetical protein
LAYVIMGAEWLFRARPLTQRDVEGALDRLEAKLRRMGLGDAMPWEASLLVGGMYDGARRGLRGVRYLVSLGQWAFPLQGWRDLVAGQERGRKNKTLAHSWKPGKPGKIPALSPIVAGILTDAFAERAQPPGGGSRALALEIASILQGKKIQPGDFGVWIRAASGPVPLAATGVPDVSPADLRTWLALRWESAYQSWFAQPQRYWSSLMVEAADNPLALFGPLGHADVVAQLYGVAWWHSPSPRRRTARSVGRRPPSGKG